MKIIRAEHLGMCFGVRDAIALALKQSEYGPITILGDLVHNETVLAELRDRGFQVENDAQNVMTRTVMVTAHGTSVRRMNAARELGLNVLSAACPLVQVAHRAVKQLAREGFHPVIIGMHDHVEVRGLTEDLHCDIVIVIGGTQSNNTRELVQTCSRFCQRVHHIQTAADLCEEWFRADDSVGITAGTSTPDQVVAEAELGIRAMDDRRNFLPKTPVLDVSSRS